MGAHALQVIRKFLLATLIVFSVQFSFSQTIWNLPGSATDTAKLRGFLKVKGFQYPVRDTNYVPQELGDAVMRPQDSTIYVATSLIHIPHWTKVGTGSTSNWGTIGGTLSSQSDLQSALNAKQNTITLGTAAQYLRGNLTLGTFTTDVLSSLNSAVFTSAGPLSYSNGFIFPKATSSIDGYLAGGDFTNFLSAYNKKVINLLISGNTTKTVTIFQQDGTQLQATFTDNVASGSSGVTSINTDTTHSQSLITGTAGTDFTIATLTGVTTFNLPTSSATNRGALSSADWISFNAKLANSDTVTKIATKWWAKNYTDTSSLIHYVNKDSLGNYLISAIAPIHVAFNNLLSTVPDSLYMDSADHTHDGYLVHADWDKLQTAYNKMSVNMTVSGFILSLIKQDGSSIPVTLPQYSNGQGINLNSLVFSLDTTFAVTKNGLLKSLDSAKIKAPSGNIIYGLSGTGTTSNNGFNFDGNGLLVSSAFPEIYMTSTSTNGRRWRLASTGAGSYSADGAFEILDGKLNTERFRIDSTGLVYVVNNFQVGAGDQTGMPVGSSINSIFNNSGNGILLGGAFRSNQTGSTTGSIQALEGYSKTSNATGNVTLSIGTIGNVEHAGAGTISTMRGGQFGSVIKGNGNVSISQALFIAPTNIASGTSTVTNSYGIYIDDALAGSGAITNKYNIYAHDAAGINYFAGNTQVNHLGGNSSTPTVVVGSSVTGTVSVVGNDLGGTITLVVTSPSALSTNAELVTLTFASVYNSTPNVVFSAANGAAISNTPSTFVKGTSTAGFSIATAPSIASLTATTYIWTYRVAN